MGSLPVSAGRNPANAEGLRQISAMPNNLALGTRQRALALASRRRFVVGRTRGCIIPAAAQSQKHSHLITGDVTF